MLRASSRFCQSARAANACRHASSSSDVAFRLADPLPSSAQCGQQAPPTQRQLVEFSNGVFVGATTSQSALTTVNIVVRAGSRYELPGEEGVAHFMRRLAYKSTDKHSAVFMTCMPQWFGMKLSCTGTREAIIYSGTCLKDDVDSMLDIMCQSIVSPKIYNWEIRYTPTEHDSMSARLTDAHQRVTQDIGGLSTNRVGTILDALQHRAFRGGLSQSVFCPTHSVGLVEEESCHAFHKRRYVGTNMGVFGAGIHPEDLVTAVTRHGLYNVPKGEVISQEAQGASTFTSASADLRIENGDSTVIAAMVGKGAGLTSEKEHISSLLLQRILGGDSVLESGTNSSRLQGAADKAAPRSVGVSQAQALNINYSDQGLFGLQVSADKADVGAVLKGAVTEFSRTCTGLTEKDIKAAKLQLTADLMATQETHEGILEDMAYQCLYRGGKYLVPEKVAERVETVTLKDVKSFGQSVVQSKHVLAQSGDLSSAAYLEELGL